MDVDHFKKINDTYGHSAGDGVLRELASRASICGRETDVSARYGGEEFAFLLPLTDVEGAMICAEKIRKAIADSPFMITDQQPLQVTVSLGISVMSLDEMNQSVSPDRIIRKADTALYRAKNLGRNQICVFDDEQDVLA